MTDQERVILMDNVKLKDVRSHYKKTHFTKNMRFVIGGKLPIERRQQIIEIIESMTIAEGKKRLQLPKEKPVKIKKPVLIENETVKNLYFYVDTFMRRAITDSESRALSILNTILMATDYSRIFGLAREKGILYDMSSGFYRFNGNSNWYIGFQISPDNILELLDIIVREIKRVFEGKISDKDIKAAKQYSLGGFQRSGQTVGSIVGFYSNNYFSEEKVYDYYKYPDEIDAVEKKQIIGVTKDLFSQNIWGIGGLGAANDELMAKIHDKLAVLWK
jgi:predicted Zn-dependent peptidase